MWRTFLFVFLILVVQSAHGYRHFQQEQDRLCGNITERARACASQILGHSDADIDSCTIEIPHTGKCSKMSFSPIESSIDIGGVKLLPYVWQDTTADYAINRTVLNITFTNIKWKTMKFRFQLGKQKNLINHCRNIVLSNDLTINDQSVLYYDCYWSIADTNNTGLSHILDFEASDDKHVNRGQYHFNIPSAQVLSPSVSEEEWVPFIYVEILSDRMRLHINPPPPQIKITAYEIKVMKESEIGNVVDEITILKLKNASKEMTYDYSLFYNGSYHFVVTPLHVKCLVIETEDEKCRSVESPRITITSDARSMSICIASLSALVVATLFAYYVAVRVIRRYCCKDYGALVPGEVPPPTKILVVYPSSNRVHAGCVASFVSYLRAECGLDVVFDGDVAATAHGDPYLWAEEAFSQASHFMYVVGPAHDGKSSNIYDKPILNTYRNVDTLLLSQLQVDQISKRRKEVLNVFFEHSKGQLPFETKRAKVFFLLKDWHKLIAYLSMNLLPKQQIMKSEKGKNFLNDLAKAKQILNENKDKMLV